MRPPFAVWLTGLPCSGKSTMAEMLCGALEERGRHAEILDGDVLRRLLSPDLAFARADREEHGRRVAARAESVMREGRVPIVSLVSPYQSMRDYARSRLSPFVEIHTDCPLGVCEARDVKGMYRLARAGRISRFTGISDPYERPASPELTLDTARFSPQKCLQKVLQYLEKDSLLQNSTEIHKFFVFNN